MNFKDQINYDENKNIKLISVFAEITNIKTSFGKLSNTLNMTNNIKLALSETIIKNNSKNDLISKLNNNHNNEEINEENKINNNNILN